LGAKLLKHQTAEPEPVEQLRPDVPPALAAIVRTLMAKQPEDRFQTPAEVAAALAGVLAPGSSFPAVPAAAVRPAEAGHSPTIIGSLWRLRVTGSGQRRLALAVTAMVVLAVGAGLALVFWHSRPVPGTELATATSRAPVTPEEKAEAEWQQLLVRYPDPQKDQEKLRQELILFRMAHAGTPLWERASQRLRELRSPL